MLMQLRRTVLTRYIPVGTLMAVLTAAASAATFGRVVPIGGQASDIALDEGRGVLYIADYTTGRIDVMSLSNNTINRSITVPTYPGALAVSPGGQYLVITHYASLGGTSLFQTGQDAVTVINLTSGLQRTFRLPSGPIGVAFGVNGLALIVTQHEFLLFDPASGSATLVDTVINVQSQTLPTTSPSFPPEIIAGSVTATGDGVHIFGVAGVTPDQGQSSSFMEFSYNVNSQRITAQKAHVSSPSLGPRVLAVNRDGTFFMDGWALMGCGTGFLECTSNGPLLAQWPAPAGTLNIGSVAIRNSKA
jgi:hypothetical protein